MILCGGWWVLRSVRMIPMALSFMAPFAALVGIFAASGRDFIAIWHEGPISGASYWANVALSPEVLVFVFFMISDPQTAPKAPLGRIIYGAATALVASSFLYFQPTEFGIKVAILSSLTVVCAFVPLIERASQRMEQGNTDAVALRGEPPVGKRLAAAARKPAVIAAAIIAVGATVDTAALATNEKLVLIERGEAGTRNGQ
jgi:Na+-translocating ferredoxin:NAD+ oxidoreductase RnfD subunit